MTTALMLLLGIVLTAGTFVFVSAEFSLVAVDQAVLDKKAEEGDRGAASVLRATRTLSTQLSGAQVGITLTTILLGYTTQSALADLLQDLLGSVGLAWGLATGIAAFVAAAFINVFSMLFGELVPKNLALAHRRRPPRHLGAGWDRELGARPHGHRTPGGDLLGALRLRAGRPRRALRRRRHLRHVHGRPLRQHDPHVHP